MSYVIRLNGYYYSGINCQGLAIYGSTASNAKHYYSRQDAESDNATVCGEISLCHLWEL